MTRRARFLGVLGAALAVAPGLVRAQIDLSDTQWKAAIVAKLAPFVDWPQGALAGRSNVVICAAGPGALVTDLEALAAGEIVKGLPIVVRQVTRERDLDECHVLFLPANRRATRHPLLRRAAALPILTVSDDESFLDEGGIVRLRLVDGHPRFDINAVNAQQSGLRISSRLLQLAVTVRGRTS